MAKLDGDLMVLGASGKMGPSLVRLAHRAAQQAGVSKPVIAVARFSNAQLATQLSSEGIETIACNLLERSELSRLPAVGNVIFMAGQKFGTTGHESLTWAINAFLAGVVAEQFRDSRIVAFSTGNVYPLRALDEGGASEITPVEPVGEYSQSALGRERIFEYASRKWGTPMVVLRLNYAVELRYGVLADIGGAVFAQQPIDLRMGMVNVIWQGDANSMCLRSLAHCQSPPLVLNISGPETLSVRYIAHEFGRRFGIEPKFSGEEAGTALLNNAALSHRMFGYPKVTPLELIDWIANWISSGGPSLNKPTHFQTRDGRY